MNPLTKAVGSMGCVLLAVPFLVAIGVVAVLGTLAPGGSAGTADAAPSKHALADIPAFMLALYQRAAPECPGLSWSILAAIGKVETDHGRHPTMISSAGAVGPMQFLPSTFKAYAYPVPPGGRKPPTPWDPVDAVYAAARLLCANGARHGRDLNRSIWHYCDYLWSTAAALLVGPQELTDPRQVRCPLVDLTASGCGCRGPTVRAAVTY
ncbi:lytic transglycosylase domain-containing protein [Streptomyces monticola]|uniref:Lytic transglycosylase domain-containing protein n=1 Tax=Streptomyces monticola TaxID=2666263 RepID=A0ABW2JMQ4_9ACTN